MVDVTTDGLFASVAAWQGDAPWGRFLDAGTGEHSLGWITNLSTEGWTAVTGDPKRARRLESRFGGKMRMLDRVVAGNWRDPGFLADQRFDTVLADYLIGAIDGFAPYYQDQVIPRLRPLVRRQLYVIGLEPYPDVANDDGGRLILEIARMRDACILLAGHRCYREYPRAWVVRQLEASGFLIERQASFPIRYGTRFVKGQLGVCRRKLPLFKDKALARTMEIAVGALEREAMAHVERVGVIGFGEDYVVKAVPV